MKQLRFVLACVGGLVVVGSCATGAVLVGSDGAVALPSVRAASVPSPMPAAVADGAAKARPLYRDGRYVATGRYLTPGGDESIGVTVELIDGMVTAAQVRTEALSPTAHQFQEQFRQRISASVVSRDVASLSVSRVAGASLTCLGFDDALAQIRVQAHVENAGA